MRWIGHYSGGSHGRTPRRYRVVARGVVDSRGNTGDAHLTVAKGPKWQSLRVLPVALSLRLNVTGVSRHLEAGWDEVAPCQALGGTG